MTGNFTDEAPDKLDGHNVRVLANQMTMMRDGVRLASDIYLPAGDGPFPVLLERTPYGKREANRADRSAADPRIKARPEIAREFAAAGYAYMLQDCRGRYASEGTFTKYLAEGDDGEDTLAWILAQDWCNGRIGTLGLSYSAHVQAALATSNPAGLGAMFLDSGGFSSAFHSGIRQGGAYELKQLTWSYRHALRAAEAAGDNNALARLHAEDISAWVWRRWQSGASPVAASPDYENYIIEQWDKDLFSPFWQQRGLYAAGYYETFADVPQVHMSSWYDPYALTAIENYTSLSRLKSAPVKLVLGPWTHGQRSVTFAGDVDFGPAACLDGNLANDFFALRREWFDHFLRGAGADPLPEPVNIFQMGGGSGRRNRDGRLDHGGEWLTAKRWPLPETHLRRYRIDGARALVATDGADTALSAVCAAPLVLRSDPAHPVPTIGGAITSGEPIMFAGGFDQRERDDIFAAAEPGRALADREDVVALRSAPLTNDLSIAGQVEANLYISCDTPDADIAIKLVDEYPPSDDYPDGYALNLAHGFLRLRFREGFDARRRLVKGEIYEVAIHAFPTCNLFKAGHRLRLDIAGSNFPHFDVNPNTAWDDDGQQDYDKPNIATLTLHTDDDHPSHLIIPVRASGVPDPG